MITRQERKSSTYSFEGTRIRSGSILFSPDAVQALREYIGYRKQGTRRNYLNSLMILRPFGEVRLRQDLKGNFTGK